MNQQRSRRFRASKEGAELVEEKKRIREEVIQRGGYLQVSVQMYSTILFTYMAINTVLILMCNRTRHRLTLSTCMDCTLP